MEIIFDDNLLTGNETIDGQHKELFDHIQNFVDACEAGGGTLKSINMLEYLMNYTTFHFDAEEALQKEAGYPELAKHVEKHTEFKKSLKELEEFLGDIEGPTAEFIDAVKKNVVDWLMFHIKTFDRSVAEYINLADNGDRL